MAKAKPITGLDIQAQTGKNACVIARTRLDEMYNWSDSVDSPYSVRELHNLGVAAKHLRYTIETLEDFLPQDCQHVGEAIEHEQEEQGGWHHGDVCIAVSL